MKFGQIASLAIYYIALKTLSILNLKKSKFLYKKWYNIISTMAYWIYNDFTCINYGFHDKKNSNHFKLLEEDKKEQYSLQLYNHFFEIYDCINTKNKNILEVGSGRGGGSSFIARYYEPAKIIGLDLSSVAVEFCKNKYKHISNLTFKQGDAEKLPFNDNSFDIIINVESSHCYPDFSRFLNEIKRVLIRGGFFLITDVRYAEQVQRFKNDMDNSGLKKIGVKDITENIINALEMDTERRRLYIEKSNAIKLIKKYLRHFNGCKGGEVYNDFVSGKKQYFSFVYQKQE